MIDARAPAVAARAAELAIDRGIELPVDLDLWRLAGGRPSAAGRSGDPRELGDLLERAHDADHRRRHGAHYTPLALAAPLVARALAGTVRPLVGDPACGGGSLLLAAGEWMVEHGVARHDAVTCLFGADIDPVAVATTEVALWLWAGVRPPRGHLLVADALLDDLPWPALNAIVGNPPFLSQLAADTTRPPDEEARLRARFGDRVQAYTDTASLFLLRSLDLVNPAGRIVLLQPQSVLGARDASPVRDAVAARGAVDEVWIPSPGAFDAAVDVCAPVIQLGERRDASSWSEHLARATGVPTVDLRASERLGDHAHTTAGFRSEFYGIAPHVHEAADLPAGRPLITAGLVDLGHCAWGERPARVAGRSWDRPVVDVAALDGRAASWVARTTRPKLVVATQTRVIEVVVDRTGALVPGVPLIAVLADPERLAPLAAALAAPAVTAWAMHRVAGTALSRSALKVTASLLRDVPLPDDHDAWSTGTAAFEAGDLQGFVDAMALAYDVGPDVGEWWVERARTVWSPTTVPR